MLVVTLAINLLQRFELSELFSADKKQLTQYFPGGIEVKRDETRNRT